MRNLLLLFFIAAASIYADEEIEAMQNLVIITKKNLESQQKMLHSLIRFKKARAAFTDDPNNGKLATYLVRKAMELQLQIEKEHLQHLFSSDFLEELSFFYQVGKHQLPHE